MRIPRPLRQVPPDFMTSDPDIDSPQVTQEPARRSGSILLVLLVAGAIVAAAVAFMTLGRANAQPSCHDVARDGFGNRRDVG